MCIPINDFCIDLLFLDRLLRDLVPKRPDLRIILMSATVNADLFAGYFRNLSPKVGSI